MYYLTRFGTYNFLSTTGNPVDFTGSGPSFPSTVRTPDSWFDFRLEQRAPADLNTITSQKLVYASPCAASAADVYRDLLAMRGKRQRLFRTWKDEPFTQEWCWARLESWPAVEEVHASKSRLFALTDLAFTKLTPYWYGQGWGDLDYTVIPYYEGQTMIPSQAAADALFTIGGAGTTTHTLTNRGNRDVLWTEVDLINHDIAATNYTLQVRNITDTDLSHGWSYDARTTGGNPIGSGAYVTIDGGRRTVIEYPVGSPVNTFSEFARVGVNEQWLVLYPGANTIEIVCTVSGGNVNLDVQFNYWDAWD
jgi:hypothetical protein